MAISRVSIVQTDGRVRLAQIAASAVVAISATLAMDPAPARADDGAGTHGWGNRAPMIEPNSEMAVAHHGDRIYVIGGYPSTRISVDTVQVYDIAADRWRLSAPYPTTINHASAVSVGGKLYVIGGQTNAGGRNEKSNYVDAVHVADTETGKWLPRAPMPTRRSAMAHAVIDGKIYVAGGRPPRGNDFAVYDPGADKWEVLPDMPTARNHMAAAAIGGKFYVAGGRFGGGFRSEITAVLEMYDPATRKWSAKAPMPEARSGLNGIVAFGCFHTFGGEHPTAGPKGVFPHHLVYSAKTDTWTRLHDMPIPVHGVTGLALDGDRIHLPGGGTRMGGSSGGTHHQTVKATMRCN